MSADTVLVTGGAGFIGSHFVDALVARGTAVRVLDSLEPQVHGPSAATARWLPPHVELIRASIADPEAVDRALHGVRAVVHLAAQVGVGQSMYAIAPYVTDNAAGTAVLLDRIVNGTRGVYRLVVASSMSIYGEGRYHCPRCGLVAPRLRPPAQLERREWEMRCPACGGAAEPRLTDEDKPLIPTSVYAITKRDQEELCLCVGRAYGVATLALRFFNVYGPRQSLSNPYTGVAAIFASRLLNGQPPVIFEDGGQSRDFVHVSDIVQALMLALDRTDVADLALNVGTGRATSVADVARGLARGLGVRVAPQIVGRFREGDIRHCVADITRITAALGYVPRVSFETGLRDLVDWCRGERPQDRVAQASAELDRRGLIR